MRLRPALIVLSCLTLGMLLAASAASGRARPFPALQFGVYPGAGLVRSTATNPVAPDVPARRLAALAALRGRRSLFVRLYAGYDGHTPTLDPGTEAQVAGFERAGYGVELVLTYRAQSANPSGFAAYTRSVVDSLGRDPRFRFLQVGNEANLGGAPGSADGAYPGAIAALVAGSIAAGDQARRDGDAQLRIGFNWAYAPPPAMRAFFSALRSPRLAASVDWVGIDVYPGVFGALPAAASPAAGAAAEVRDSLLATRRGIGLAGLSSRTAVHVSECGYATGAGRTPTVQAQILRAEVTTTAALARAERITSFSWFDLRDQNADQSTFHGNFGLLTSDYRPKPAFAAYRALIARL